MPAPLGQSCANCQYFFPRTPIGGGPTTNGTCQIDAPSAINNRRNWAPEITSEKWCGRWAASGTGISGLQPFDSVAGYRGNDTTGTTLSLTNDWLLLTPTWVDVVGARNFSLESAGVIKLDITTATVSATTELYMTFFVAVAFSAGSNNEDMEMTIGQNGTPLEDYRMPLSFRTAGATGEISVFGALAVEDQDTFGVYARSPTSTDATYISFHELLQSIKVLTY